MNTIKNTHYHGERPLFNSHSLKLENIKILDGESAIKECQNITCSDSYFNGKYPFWHVDNTLIENCTFDTNARAAIWYSHKITMKNSTIDCPKMFRRASKIILDKVNFTDAKETLWDCNEISLQDCKAVNGDYIFFNSQNIIVENFNLQGNYSFQNCKNIIVRNSILDSRDAFWETENVQVENCILKGEYLAWHSKNVRFINCKIEGTQPLCYADDLILDNCTFDKDCDLAFEYSNVSANILGDITSVKNPIHGFINADNIHEIILDEYRRSNSDCIIKERSKE